MATVLGPEHLPVRSNTVSKHSPALTSRLQEDEPDDMLLDPNDEDAAIPSRAQAVKAEPKDEDVENERAAIDPLNMLADEEEEDEARQAIPVQATPVEEVSEEKLEVIEAVPLKFANWKLPPPRALTAQARKNLLISALKRIWTSGQDIEQQAFDISALEDQSEHRIGLADTESSVTGRFVKPKAAWLLLVARLGSRGLVGTGQEAGEGNGQLRDVRKALSDYIAEDFSNR